MQTQKSKTRRVCTLLTGSIQARELRKRCGHCPAAPVAVSAQLAALVPPQQRYGYYLIAWVGLARYHQHRQRREIRAALARQGMPLAAGSVSALCDRFLRALETLHRYKAPALRAAMAAGYPLHIDATSDKGRGGLFLCLDGWRGWVLHALKVSSENAAELQPAIEHTVAAFGPPLATMRDLGSAGAKAVAGCRLEAVPDLVCHYHFLAAVGKQLLDVEYAALRSQLRRSKVRSGLRELLRSLRGRARVRADLAALILWVLEGSGHKHPPYPFALPHWDFYRRCGQFRHKARRWLPGPRTPAERRVLRQASALLATLGRRQRIAWAVPRLERTNNVAEHFFATSKQKLRRRLGRAHLGRDMEDQPAQAALAANLLCPDYVRIVCGTLDRLPQAFAALDRKAITESTPLQRNHKDAALRKRIRAWTADGE